MKASIAPIVIALASVLQISGVATHVTRAGAGTATATATGTGTGTVVSSKGSLLVIELESGVRRLFVMSETTLMPASLLTTGDRVAVKYRPGSLPVDVLELEVLSRAAFETSRGAGEHPEPAPWRRFVE